MYWNLVDFSKGFDLIDRQIPIERLHIYSKRHKTMEWLSSNLTDRSQVVEVQV